MNNTLTDQFKINFEKAYNDLYAIHSTLEEDNFRFRYLRVDWFFPQHIQNVLEQIKLISHLYFKDINLEICLFAGLFHDAGLVYKRETASPVGHENRSVEYAEEALSVLGYDKDFIESVSECIKATEPDYTSDVPEALVVRNSDAYAHIISMHFFAKANFSNDMSSFVKWFNDKLDLVFMKITIPELKQKISPLVGSYKEMIENYLAHKDHQGSISHLLSN